MTTTWPPPRLEVATPPTICRRARRPAASSAGKGFAVYGHRTWRYKRNGSAGTGTRPRQLEGGPSLRPADLRTGLGVERLLSPTLPGRPARPIHDAYQYVRAARRCDDPADHAHPDDRCPHHAPLRQ